MCEDAQFLEELKTITKDLTKHIRNNDKSRGDFSYNVNYHRTNCYEKELKKLNVPYSISPYPYAGVTRIIVPKSY